MKKKNFLFVSLIAIIAICFISCSRNKKYVFDDSKVSFNPWSFFFDPDWDLKEKTPEGDVVFYFFLESEIHDTLSGYSIKPKIKRSYNKFNYPQAKQDSVIRERAKIIVSKIDSVNAVEIENRLKEFRVQK